MRLHYKMIILFLFGVAIALNENFNIFSDDTRFNWKLQTISFYIGLTAFTYWLAMAYKETDKKVYFTSFFLSIFFASQVIDCILWNPYIFQPNDFIMILTGAGWVCWDYKGYTWRKLYKHNRLLAYCIIALLFWLLSFIVYRLIYG